jgi:hypothetical protein
MSPAQGFMIPLNHADWTASGDRTNWCSTQAWWNNENIKLVGSSLGPTTVLAGDSVSIGVGLQGVADGGGETQANGDVQTVQAWVCYPSPTAGHSSASLVVHSMQTTTTPELTGDNPVTGVNAAGNPGDYQSTAGSPPPYEFLTLNNPWTPTAADQVGPPNPNDPDSIHCCIIANSAGLSQAIRHGAGWQGNSTGVTLSGLGDLATEIDICNQPYQGQVNIAILTALHGIHMRRVIFGFLAAGTERPSEVVLKVTPLAQEKGVDPALLRVLKEGPFRDLPLQPATKPLKDLRLVDNTHRFQGKLAELIRRAEELMEHRVEDEAHPFAATSGLKLKLPPHGVHPLQLEMQLDPDLPEGSVHAFDITQTEAGGRRGGIRVAAVVVPEKHVRR